MDMYLKGLISNNKPDACLIIFALSQQHHFQTNRMQEKDREGAREKANVSVCV